MSGRRSPWQRALGSAYDDLDPGLRAYFGAIPAGSVGRGEGVFDTIGTPRRWLWPLLAVLAREGVLFPVWARAVRFTVENRPTAAGTVRAARAFSFPNGTRVMVDETGITAAGLTDRLGARRIVSVVLAPSVAEGRLELRSTAAALRFGPLRVPLGALAPRVTLVERREGELQHVSLVLVAPVVGRLYEYSGSFSYRVERDDSV